MEPFRTARLRLTPVGPGDLADLVELHLDPEVSRFLGGVRSPEQTAAYLQTNIRHWTDHGFGLYALRTEDGAFAGRAGIRYTDLEGVRELEIAYTLRRPLWAQGLATEVTQALIQLWRESLPDPSLCGIVIRGHSTSERVLAKTGFLYERDATSHGEPVGVHRLLRR